MPKVAYSEEERKQIRQSLIAAGLDLMSRQGIQHTTVEQIYKKWVFHVLSSILFSLPRRISS